jgi:hypothetical protein
MSRQSDLGNAQNARREALGNELAVRAVRVFRTVPLDDLEAGWDRVAPRLLSLVTAAQLVASQQSVPYMAAVDQSWGYRAKPVTLNEGAFAGVMGDGREVAPAMYGAVTQTKRLIGSGLAPARAFESGAAFLAILAQTAVHDLGRSSDGVLAAGKGYTLYVRVINTGACSRCAILAGKSSGMVAFQRHVSCKCGAMAIPGGAKIPDGLYSSPEEYFDSLSVTEQSRVFTKAGAEAIREGANPIQVVNARRGAYGIGYKGRSNVPSSGNRLKPLTIGVKADGSPLRVFATTEGTTRRGQFGRNNFEGGSRRTTSIRLMPEQISVMAGGNSERYRELLKKYGYLD